MRLRRLTRACIPLLSCIIAAQATHGLPIEFTPDCRVRPIGVGNRAGLPPDRNRTANRTATFSRQTDAIKQLR